MARTPVLTSTTLTPFGGGGGGFGAFSIINPGQTAYLAFLKEKVRWEAGEISNATYLAAYELYVSKLKEGSTNRISAQQSFDETKYRLARNDLMADIDAGTAEWDDLLEFDRSKLAGLNTDSQTYIDRLELYRATQARALQERAGDQHELYDQGKLSTAQLRAWYLDQAADPDLALNPELADSIADQIESLDLRLTSEADQHMLDQFRDGKVSNDAFLAYATAARARYSSGTEDQKRWDDIITDAKAAIAEGGLTYRYGLSQDYIQLQKFIADQKEMLRRAGQSSTSTSQRIVLGANGQWKTVTSTSSQPYKPSAAEQRAMRERRQELAAAERQLAEWTRKIKASGGFVTTRQMLGFYQSRQADTVKGTDEWYQLQARIDGLQQQLFQEQVLKKQGIRITFGAGDGPAVGRRDGGGTSGGGGYAGGAGTAQATGRGGAGTGTKQPKQPKTGEGPLQIVTGSITVPKRGTQITTRAARFPNNLDGSAFLKFYSGFVAAYEAGATTFTDWSSGKPVTYYLPDDPAERVKMIGTLDDMRINYYATRAQVYAGTPSEIVAAKEYSDAIKDKAENAYLILITEAKGGRILPTGGKKGIVNPIEQGLKVRDAAKAYYDQQVKLAQQAWERGDVTGAWAHLQLATRRVAETEARVRQYLGAAKAQINAIYGATGEKPPEEVEGAYEDLADWSSTFTASKNDASKLTNEVYKWTKLGANGQPTYSADGTLSLHDGAAIFVNPDGRVDYKEVSSAGYAGPGSSQQIPDVPGYVRVTVNLGGTVPGQTVYAKWTPGIVGYTATGQPIQGKVVSGFLNGQRYTLVENPFAPGKWSLGNQAINVPSSFKPVAGQEGVYQFNDGKTNYLLRFDPKTGQYEVVTPGTPFAAEQAIPISEADAQTLLQGTGFGIDISAVPAAERWKYNLSQPYAGFTQGELQKFTTPPSSLPGRSIALTGIPFRDETVATLQAEKMLGKRLQRAPGIRIEATGIPFVDETVATLQAEKMQARRLRYPATQQASQQAGPSRPAARPFVDETVATLQAEKMQARQLLQSSRQVQPALPGLDTRDELLAEKRTMMQIRTADLRQPTKTSAKTTTSQPARRKKRRRAASTTTTTKVASAPQLPRIPSAKLAILETI